MPSQGRPCCCVYTVWKAEDSDPSQPGSSSPPAIWLAVIAISDWPAKKKA